MQLPIFPQGNQAKKLQRKGMATSGMHCSGMMTADLLTFTYALKEEKWGSEGFKIFIKMSHKDGYIRERHQRSLASLAIGGQLTLD